MNLERAYDSKQAPRSGYGSARIGCRRPTIFRMRGFFMHETWKVCTYYGNGFYDVSSTGRVRSWYKLRHRKREKKPRLAKQSLDSRGFYYVAYLYENGTYKSISVHILVADAFLGPRPHGLTVNHKDLNKKNNHIENLEYITLTENIKHAAKMGRMAWGPSLTREKALQIKNAPGSHRKIAKQFSIGKTLVGTIKAGQRCYGDL